MNLFLLTISFHVGVFLCCHFLMGMYKPRNFLSGVNVWLHSSFTSLFFNLLPLQRESKDVNHGCLSLTGDWKHRVNKSFISFHWSKFLYLKGPFDQARLEKTRFCCHASAFVPILWGCGIRLWCITARDSFCPLNWHWASWVRWKKKSFLVLPKSYLSCHGSIWKWFYWVLKLIFSSP